MNKMPEMSGKHRTDPSRDEKPANSIVKLVDVTKQILPSWLPHCQEKSVKTKKKDKSPENSGENGGF